MEKERSSHSLFPVLASPTVVPEHNQIFHLLADDSPLPGGPSLSALFSDSSLRTKDSLPEVLFLNDHSTQEAIGQTLLPLQPKANKFQRNNCVIVDYDITIGGAGTKLSILPRFL